MSPLTQILIGLAIVGTVAGAASGWYARGVVEERDELKALTAELRGARVLEAGDRRAAAEASTRYQQDIARIRATLATPAPEVDDAMRKPIECREGASAVPLGDVPIPAGVVNRLRRAADQ